jgi:hypothetical protein
MEAPHELRFFTERRLRHIWKLRFPERQRQAVRILKEKLAASLNRVAVRIQCSWLLRPLFVLDHINPVPERLSGPRSTTSSSAQQPSPVVSASASCSSTTPVKFAVPVYPPEPVASFQNAHSSPRSSNSMLAIRPFGRM